MGRAFGNDLIQLGNRLKKARNRRGFTLEVVARRAGISKGLLSKLENFRAIPSLPVLCSVAKALGVDMGYLVRGMGLGAENAPYVLTRAKKREVIQRDDAFKFLYESLGSRTSGATIVEGFVLTISAESRRKAVSTNGEQCIYILEGEIEFRYGRERLTLSKGDSLLFDGTVPHVPKCRKGARAVLLALYILHNTTKSMPLA